MLICMIRCNKKNWKSYCQKESNRGIRGNEKCQIHALFLFCDIDQKILVFLYIEKPEEKILPF